MIIGNDLNDVNQKVPEVPWKDLNLGFFSVAVISFCQVFKWKELVNLSCCVCGRRMTTGL